MTDYSKNGNFIKLYVRLKNHLTNDYVQLSEKKNELENELIQLKIDRERKDKKLFQNIEQKNMRRYFSPLNIEESKDRNQDEKLKQLNLDIQTREDEIINLAKNMESLQDLIEELDTFCSGYGHFQQ